MLQIAPQMRILVAIEPVDLTKAIDGLAELWGMIRLLYHRKLRISGAKAHAALYKTST